MFDGGGQGGGGLPQRCIECGGAVVWRPPAVAIAPVPPDPPRMVLAASVSNCCASVPWSRSRGLISLDGVIPSRSAEAGVDDGSDRPVHLACLEMPNGCKGEPVDTRGVRRCLGC